MKQTPPIQSVDDCLNKVMAESERNIWFKSAESHNTAAIMRYMAMGCYGCNPETQQGKEKECYNGIRQYFI